MLEVRWRGDVAEEAFTIKCRTEELLRQWQRTIMKAVEESPNRRRAHHLSNSRRGGNSPLSQFPATPLSESGPSVGSELHSYANSAQPSYPPNSNGFDDEGEEYHDHSESGRSTPSTMARRGPSMRSLPSADRDPTNGSRPRAQTDSNAINNWRNQTPNDPVMPILPRGVSITSNNSDSLSLRSSASSRQLRDKQSSEWNGTTSPALGYARLQNGGGEEDSVHRPSNVPRQMSHSVLPTPHASAPLIRNRSASSPNIYQLPPPGSASLSQEEWSPYSEEPSNPPMSIVPPVVPPITTMAKSAATLASTKRMSSSSNGTDRSSGASSQSQGQTYTAATSPATTIPSHSSLPANGRIYSTSHLSSSSILPPLPVASAVRVKVTYGDDTFVVVVLSSVSYRELLDKVLKKLRLCGERGSVDEATLRLRYEDEDGDRILITSGEDVAMAFEAARMSDVVGPAQTLVLFATVDTTATVVSVG